MVSTAELASNVAESIDAAVRRYCEDRERDDTKTRGDGFAIWCLTDLFGFERDSAIDALLDGRGDQSIDALADDGNRLIVLQAKYNSHDWAEITKFKEDARRVGSGQTSGLPQRLRPAVARIRDRRESGLPLEYYYVTNQKFSGDDQSRLGALEGDPAIGAYDLDWICHIFLERQSERPLNAPSHQVHLKPMTAPLPFEQSLIMPVSLREFARFVADGEQWLFNSNVRQYLAKSKINQGIRDTVEKESSHFWRYNNGVTMVVDEFSYEDDSVALYKPQIVNGCQTSLSIARVAAAMPESQRELLEGSVLVRVIRERSDDERRKITEFTNKQNAVRGKDFFALQDFQHALKQKIDGLGYFYEIQTGSFDFLARSDKEKLKGDPRFTHLEWARRDYRIQAIEAAKCYAAAFRDKIAVCYANPGDLAPSGDLHDTIFPADLPDDPEPFLLPFLLMKHAERTLGYGAPKGEAWRRRGRYMFIFALFRTLREALQRANRLEVGEELSPARLREVVAREEITLGLVALNDRIMENFFSDSAVHKLVNDDIFGFLKGPVERKDSLEVLDLKISAALDSAGGRQLVETLKVALPN
ncbi:MAG: AIPR family protein [Dehalococcoidia bacterium]